ncbi:MAG: dihydroorotase [Chloroflexi bacterium]|nr:dihydroorotase [Chloroflexota bacterium]
MSASLLIRGGRIVDPANGIDAVGDLLVRDGRVAAVDTSGGLSAPEGTPELDARGLVVAPGFVDLHCHLREPGFEEKETIATGTRAAARGGFTTVCCMPNTHPAIDTRATVEFILGQARAEGAVRVLPVGAVTIERAGRELVDMSELAEAGVVAFSDDGMPVADAHLMRSALAFSRVLGLPVMDHCEDQSLARGVMHEGRVATALGLGGNPAAAEDTMVARDVFLAELTGGHVHIAHLSTKGAVELVRQAKERGLAVTAEVTPHHLTLTDETIAGRKGLDGGRHDGLAAGNAYDSNAKVNPPLRSQDHVDALVAGLRDGVIDAIATDHAPHTVVDKLCEFDLAEFGISGFETALGSVLALVHDGRIGLPALVERLTWGPARIVDVGRTGIGTLGVGAPGDVVLFDLDQEWVVDAESFASKGKNTPLDGRRLKGQVVATVVGGSVAHAARDTVMAHGW